MKKYFEQHGKWLVINAVIWCLAKQLFLAIKLWGIENTEVQRFQFPLWSLFLVIALTGLLDGILFGIVDILIDNKFRSFRFSQRIASKTLLNMVLGMTMTFLLVPVLLQWFLDIEIRVLSKKLYTAQIIILMVYFLVNTIIVQFLKLTISWMKTQDILDIIAHPYGVEEDRIFLFLDMKSSTSLAEQLETTRYSRLLQECFQDLSGAAKETGADIYQYVGDEAVLTWQETEENYQQAALFFFRFQAYLSERSSLYRDQFGVVPEFKCGIHHGRVIKAQVGMMRKEIAFHGDAINTAARIQSKCSELNKKVLVSESYSYHLRGSFTCLLEGSFPIRGKTNEMNLYSVADNGILSIEKREEGFLLKRAIEAIRYQFKRSGQAQENLYREDVLAIDFNDVNHWFI